VLAAATAGAAALARRPSSGMGVVDMAPW